MWSSVVAKSPDQIDVLVGARLRFRRMMVGMSQEALGDALGVTFQQIQKYEKGHNRIGAGRLFQISRVLGVPVGYFFEDAPPAERAAAAAGGEGAVPDPLSFVASQEGLELNLAFSQIADGATRRKIVDLVRTLATGA
jgi:transcriptional regulator with XRE-family HTH domain